MARRRKIPARKHHGVRDPLKQLEQKEKKLKNHINNPPEIGNDQKVSFKFAQFKKLADDTKQGKKLKRLKAGIEDVPTTKKNKNNVYNKVRNIRQFAGETDEDYLRRVNRATTESLKEAQYEAKYGVNVVHDPKTGMITVKKRPKNEIDELIKQKEQEKLNKKRGRRGKQAQPAKKLDPALVKSLIKQAIKEDEEEKKKESNTIEEYKRDVISFGEIVHAPPTLSTLPRKAQKADTVPRPGKKSNLLLKSLLEQTNTEDSTRKATANKSKNVQSNAVTKLQLKGKRKDLPLATRSMLENEQSKMVDLYRQLKKSKLKTLS